MFIRKRKNRTGAVTVVVVDKSNGKFKEIKTIGVSSDPSEIDELYLRGKKWILSQQGIYDMFEEHKRQEEEKKVTDYLLSNIENILLNGTQLILNHVFNKIGFNKIEDIILKHLVISRICQPRSKVATVDYLKSYFDEDIELHKIYRYLDKLHDGQKEIVQIGRAHV